MRNLVLLTTVLLCILCLISCGTDDHKMYFDTIYNIKVEVESGEITKEMKSVFFHPDILESRR